MMIADRTKYEFDHHSQEEDLFNKRGEAKATESTIDSRPLNDFGMRRHTHTQNERERERESILYQREIGRLKEGEKGRGYLR